jgi:poly(3-hydroxybutyrate) depolymerase
MTALKKAAADISFDRSKVYAVGLSSGAILANVLGSCYPDIFSGVALHSGIEYAEPAMPRDLGDGHMRCPVVSSFISGTLAYSCSLLSPKKLPNVILFQGDQDQRVYPCNSNSVFEQWIRMENLSGVQTSEKDAKFGKGSNPGGYTFEMREIDNANDWKMRQVIVNGMAHAWSGGAAGHFASDPLGPDATEIMWEFLSKQH